MDRLSRQIAPKQRGRLYAGALLCALVVLFSLAAKVSWYRAHESQRQLSSMKAFKGDLPVAGSVELATVMPVGVPMLWALAAMMFAVCVAQSQAPEERVRVQSAFVRRPVARPPPVR